MVCFFSWNKHARRGRQPLTLYCVFYKGEGVQRTKEGKDSLWPSCRWNVRFKHTDDQWRGVPQGALYTFYKTRYSLSRRHYKNLATPNWLLLLIQPLEGSLIIGCTRYTAVSMQGEPAAFQRSLPCQRATKTDPRGEKVDKRRSARPWR